MKCLGPTATTAMVLSGFWQMADFTGAERE